MPPPEEMRGRLGEQKKNPVRSARPRRQGETALEGRKKKAFLLGSPESHEGRRGNRKTSGTSSDDLGKGDLVKKVWGKKIRKGPFAMAGRDVARR